MPSVFVAPKAVIRKIMRNVQPIYRCPICGEESNTKLSIAHNSGVDHTRYVLDGEASE